MKNYVFGAVVWLHGLASALLFRQGEIELATGALCVVLAMCACVPALIIGGGLEDGIQGIGGGPDYDRSLPKREKWYSPRSYCECDHD